MSTDAWWLGLTRIPSCSDRLWCMEVHDDRPREGSPGSHHAGAGAGWYVGRLPHLRAPVLKGRCVMPSRPPRTPGTFRPTLQDLLDRVRINTSLREVCGALWP